ncbi:MAG TPA: NBR1-Ig-like domain-containing protein [Anaerolineales bacterium]|nr:NBR1-Ig-like domain-containing protein [Anaerolineales bacterium]
MNKKIFLLLYLLSSLACVIPGLVTPAPILQATMPAGGLETVIAQTAGAAQTQTAAVLPTDTATPTVTRTPSVTPSPTVTFIYRLYTDTPFPSETPTLDVKIGVPGGGQSGDGTPAKTEKPIFTGKEWTCTVVEKQPRNGAVVKAKVTFYVTFTILNTGTKAWTINGLDFVYTGGYRPEGTKIKDFTKNVTTGQKISMTATFIAPKTPSEYQTFFTLQVGNHQFCSMKIAFEVIE